MRIGHQCAMPGSKVTNKSLRLPYSDLLTGYPMLFFKKFAYVDLKAQATFSKSPAVSGHY